MCSWQLVFSVCFMTLWSEEEGVNCWFVGGGRSSSRRTMDTGYIKLTSRHSRERLDLRWFEAFSELAEKCLLTLWYNQLIMEATFLCSCHLKAVCHLTRFTCMVFSQFFSLLMPALLMTTSRRPNWSTVLWKVSVPQTKAATGSDLKRWCSFIVNYSVHVVLQCARYTLYINKDLHMCAQYICIIILLFLIF